MARNSVATMLNKVAALRQITGGKAFSMSSLSGEACSKMGYVSRDSLHMFLSRLVTGHGYAGRQLTRIDVGRYAWLNASNAEVVEPAKPNLVQLTAKNLTLNETVALDEIKRITTDSQDGAIRLIATMFKLGPDEFMDFMDKLESVKVVQAIGSNRRAVGGQVWGLVRDKFSDFYHAARAYQASLYEFNTEPEPVPPTEVVGWKVKAKTKTKVAPRVPSSAEKQLEALCLVMGKELTASKVKIDTLKAELGAAQTQYSEEERSYNVFCSELDRLQHRAKPNTR